MSSAQDDTEAPDVTFRSNAKVVGLIEEEYEAYAEEVGL